MRLLKKLGTILWAALLVLGVVAQGLPPIIAPQGKSLGLKWFTREVSGAPVLTATMDAKPAGVVLQLDLRTTGVLSNAVFTAEVVQRKDLLVVGDLVRRASGTDTTYWSMRIHRSASSPDCPTLGLPRPAFCWSAVGDTFKLVPPAGTKTLVLEHWTVAPSGDDADTDGKDQTRKRIQVLGWIGIVVGGIGILVQVIGVATRTKPLDGPSYVEGVIAAMKGDPKARRRNKTVAGWVFIDHMDDYEAALKAIAAEFKPKPERDELPAVWHSSAVREFQRVHDEIVNPVANHLAKTRDAVKTFNDNQKVEIEREQARVAAEQRLAHENTGPARTEHPKSE